MNGSAVVNCHSARRPAGINRAIQIEISQVLSAEAAHPVIAVVLIKKVQQVAAGNEAYVAHFGNHICKENSEGQRAVIGMRPKLDVLMPLDLFAATRRFEIQLTVMEFDIGTEQILDNIDKDGFTRELPKSGVDIRR